MKITAVILAYWKERFENIPKIIQALQDGTRPPDEIIVFNNNANYNFHIDTEQLENVNVINSKKNYHGHSRLAVALLEPSDYYLFIDDDLCPQLRMLENLVEWKELHPNREVTGLLGKKLAGNSDKPYSNADSVDASDLDKPEVVDLTIRLHFASRYAVTRALDHVEDSDQGIDDIRLAQPHDNRPVFVVPANEHTEFVNGLDEADVGYWKREEHFELRDIMCKEAFNLQS